MTFGTRVSHILREKTGPEDSELQETLQEALSQVAAEDLIAVADELAERHQLFVRKFANEKAAWSPTGDDAEMVSQAVTFSRGHANELVSYLAQIDAAPLVNELLHGKEAASVRIEQFTQSLDGLDPRLGIEFATGLLHYTDPQSNWLWTRWMWDVTTQTGILPLTTGSTHNLVAASVAEGYLNVGSVSAMSMRFAEGAGLLTPELIDHPTRSPFGVDVFLACAYSVYLYGITAWRLSREFNNLMPRLPNMMRRLLGLPKQSGLVSSSLDSAQAEEAINTQKH